MTPSFELIGPRPPRRPVVISVPHAGRDYPPALLAATRLSGPQLRLLEDRHADHLAEAAGAAGFTVIVARRPRAWIDLNRDPRELDADMIEPRPTAEAAWRTARVVGGLGLVPRRLRGCGDIWRSKLALGDVQKRIVEDHLPYHAELARLLSSARARCGAAVLLDLHSMPSVPQGSDVVIGDRFGQSAGARFAAAARAPCEAGGYSVAENVPYAGGYLLEAHGRPRADVHALQIEIDRARYLDARGRSPSLELPRMAALVSAIAVALEDEALGARLAHAAE